MNQFTVFNNKETEYTFEFSTIDYQNDDTGLPKSNVLQFLTEDGTKLSVRPSGTEPKIKFYVSVNTTLESVENFKSTEAKLDQKAEAMLKDMKLI